VASAAERRRQDPADLGGNGGVDASLRLPYDEHAVEQLQTLPDEDAEIDEPLVLDTSPASGRDFPFEGGGHDVTLPGGQRDRQRP
jgi:hypothetical protein